MQIFLSHSSKQKPLVREVVRNLPKYISIWVDEDKLLFGDDITVSLEETIKFDTDYVIVFLDEYASASGWVAKELEWAIEAEKTHNRIILLTVVLDENAFQKIKNIEIQKRKYVSLKDYSESSIHALAAEITSELFALVCRDMDALRTPKQKAISATIVDVDDLIRAKAKLIQKAVFPHRQSNPISLQSLREVVNSQSPDQLDSDEFESILSRVIQNSLIPGLYYDGFEIFLVEEHMRWKTEVHHDRKERIGRKVSSLISNGAKVFLDAGSTTAEVAAILCKKIENHALTKITLATTSINIADMISNCCVKMGFDDDFSAVQLFIPGGKVRQGTQAIIRTDANSHEILRIAEQIGGFDIGVIGVNGVDIEHGFTTHANIEVVNKIDIIKSAKNHILAGDSSKIGIVLEEKFADFSDDVQFVVDNNNDNDDLRKIVETYKSKIVLA